MKGMQYEFVRANRVQEFIDDDAWVMEQKLDGVRIMLHIDENGVRFHGSNDDTEITFAAATQWFDGIREWATYLPVCVIDGELLIETGEFVAFDLPYVRDLINPSEPLHVRRAALVTLGELGGFRVVKQALSAADKRLLWDQVVLANLEGVVVKDIDAPYHIGQRTWDVLKIKITHTIDVVVIGRRVNGAENAELGLYRNGELVKVGACSMIGKQAEVGDVIEVEFQCVRDIDNPCLYQPRMQRRREDKLPTDCAWDQIDGAIGNKGVLQ